jgi:hypothetical protein
MKVGLEHIWDDEGNYLKKKFERIRNKKHGLFLKDVFAKLEKNFEDVHEFGDDMYNVIEKRAYQKLKKHFGLGTKAFVPKDEMHFGVDDAEKKVNP